MYIYTCIYMYPLSCAYEINRVFILMSEQATLINGLKKKISYNKTM